MVHSRVIACCTTFQVSLPLLPSWLPDERLDEMPGVRRFSNMRNTGKKMSYQWHAPCFQKSPIRRQSYARWTRSIPVADTDVSLLFQWPQTFKTSCLLHIGTNLEKHESDTVSLEVLHTLSVGYFMCRTNKKVGMVLWCIGYIEVSWQVRWYFCSWRFFTTCFVKKEQ